MGEKRIKEFMTFKDLVERYGWSESFFYKKAKLLEPALLKVCGKAPKPYRYDADLVEQLICADSDSMPEKKAKPVRSIKNRARLKAAKTTDEDDDLWR